MEERLKHLLWPLRPILRPVWHRIGPIVDRLSPGRLAMPMERAIARAGDRARAFRGMPAPKIRPLRHYELVELAIAEPYYRPRLAYMGAAARVAADLIDRRGLSTALELGPHLRPLIVGADAMDLSERPALQAEGRKIIHDATVAPWPIDDKAYDLFVALQVFEHLRSSQPEAFREVRRVARHAMVSLPIDWLMANPNDCHHQLSHDRVLSWFAPIRPTAVLLGNGGRRRRLIYVFEDLPAPESASIQAGPIASLDEVIAPTSDGPVA